MATDEDVVDSQLEPDPVQYDPMAEVCWTLPMAVAWIRWQTADAVREQWDDWRSQQGRRMASLQSLTLSAPENKAAWLDLFRHLHSAQTSITGTGICTTGDVPRRTPIPHYEWASLEDQTTGDPDYAPKFRYPHTSPAAGHGYDDILIAPMSRGSGQPGQPSPRLRQTANRRP